jgi:hypothetical protein
MDYEYLKYKVSDFIYQALLKDASFRGVWHMFLD